MSQYTLIQPGPRRYVINPASRTVQVTLAQKTLHVALTRSVVVVNTGTSPEPDTDFLLAYQLSKL